LIVSCAPVAARAMAAHGLDTPWPALRMSLEDVVAGLQKELAREESRSSSRMDREAVINKPDNLSIS
jgi:hypothetical protein